MKKRADGRYRRKLVDKNGKNVYFYGETQREVNLKIMEYKEREAHGRPFSAVAEEWWGDALENISPTSVRGYRVAKERAIEEWGSTAIREINARMIGAYLFKLAKQGYAKKTVKNHKIVVNRIFHHALMMGDVEHLPTVGVEIPRGLQETRRKAASTDDEDIIRNSADLWIMPYMALMTGLRKGELLALQWKDIDFEANHISVTKSLYWEGGAHIKTPKTESGNRIVPLLKPLKEELLKRKGSADDYIISDDGAKPLSQKRFRTLEKHFKEATGITCTMHCLRKSFATIAVRENLPPKLLQAIIGHKNIQTTLDIYAEVRKESIDISGEILNNAFSHKRGQKETETAIKS